MKPAKIVPVIITILVIGIALAFTAQRIGAVIGWEQAASAWPVVVLLVVVILLVAWFILGALRSKLK